MILWSTTSKHKHFIHNRDVLQTMWEGSTKQLLLMTSQDNIAKRGETTSWRGSRIWRKKKVNYSIFLYAPGESDKTFIWSVLKRCNKTQHPERGRGGGWFIIINLWTRLVFQHSLHKSICASQINSVIFLDNQNKYGNLYHSFSFQFTGPHHTAFTCKHCITNYI